ncbi:MAG: primosomal protein N' [Gemmatimonadetes bacterium]|nr:primosomal protein N' [Gemmatimonadota bacterium]
MALPLPIPTTFTYAVRGPPPAPGTRVLVPFRRSERIGWVVEEGAAGRVKGVRAVLDVLDDAPTVTADVLELCRWMADYYVCPLGIALRAALPAVLTDVSRDYVSLARAGSDGDRPGAPAGAGPVPDTSAGAGLPAADLSARERRFLEVLARHEAPQRVATLRRTLDMGSVWPEVRSLKARGLLRHETVPPRPPPVLTRRVVRVVRWLDDLVQREELFGRARRQREAYEVLEAGGGSAELAHLLDQHGFSRSVVTGLEEKGVVEVADEEVLRDPFHGADAAAPVAHTLTGDQLAALDVAARGMDEAAPAPVLLHGVTGSGKTRVYIELLRRVLEGGRTAIVLVPEISLTPQTVTRFRAWFGDDVAVLHSALSDGERYDQWRLLRSGDKRIAVGARSALFAPLDRLGAIVVDEEHDGSYKQSEAPRYHARDLAVVRAAMAGATCVLGSATPSLESWTNVERGKFVRATLPERVGGGRLPPVRVVDLREVRRHEREEGARHGGSGGGSTVLSPPLVEAVEARLAREEQVILLLNRRGYASFVQCRECGDVRSCVHCSVSLTYHRVSGRLLCHHCRYEEPAPERCARCGSTDLNYRGLGTEQVERIVAETFPRARLARMDVDTTSGKWSHHEILGRVERGEVDILMGTQMIAKGLDFPRVTLVGVVNADVGIHLPDFRASERTFQLLAQVAGRAGRGILAGEVVVQTSLPDHYAIQAALAHDYEAFAERELEERTAPAYPPHVRLANVVVSSPDAEAAAAAAQDGARRMRRWLGRSGEEVELVGPAPSPIERLHGRWRWHFLLRSASSTGLGRACRVLVEKWTPTGGDVRVALDRDPVALL